MKTHRSKMLLMLAGAACALCLVGCALKVNERRISSQPPPMQTLDGESPFLKAHRADGRVHIFAGWRIDPEAATVTGLARTYDAHRKLLETSEVAVAIDSVAIFESNVIQTSPAVGGLTVLSVLSAGFSAYCLANPKACFGSCPTFYAPGENGQPLLQAEGFSASVAPILEDEDIDALPRCRIDDRRLEIVMTNEALETHVVRQVDLLVAHREDGERVVATDDGRYVRTGRHTAPRRAIGPEGDIGDLLQRSDGRERISLADSSDLSAREEIELVFEAPGDGALGLVVVSRQALVSTYLFYQGLAYLGSEAAPALARARQLLDPVAGGNTFGSLLGRIEISVRDKNGDWRTAGAVGETGPLAANAHSVRLGADLPSPVHVRLSLAKGCWRLDQVAIAPLLGETPAERFTPSAVRRHGADDPDALAVLLDPDLKLVTYPGDRYTLVYDLPRDGAECEVFLHSRGYYLEWMRKEWLVEENRLQAASLMLAPRRMLRELAPAFKELEPDMEAQFWGSRYVQ